MARMLVNLDAMIAREDFADQESPESTYAGIDSISVRDFTAAGLVGPSLRKPDFQRETNHWVPEQVATLLSCYVSGDLIPSVILWRSKSHLFVIDGGHRLSVLRAWVEDDYGDGPISQAYFGFEVSADQRRAARKTRELVAKSVGTWKHLLARQGQSDLGPQERENINTAVSRAIPIQWVSGDPGKAESSFFRINTEGTPLDEVEELLLRSRRKPIAIAARAVIRAGKGHRYWSAFGPDVSTTIESLASTLHKVLFEPALNSPVKTLDLPLGGSKGVRAALQILIDFMRIAIRGQSAELPSFKDMPEDADGTATVAVLEASLRLAQRVTGNERGSLGLHPAVYYYGPSGRHSSAMFLSTVSLIARRLASNDKNYLRKFTEVRARLEEALIAHRELIAGILQKMISSRRNEQYEKLLENVIDDLTLGAALTEESIVQASGLKGKALTGTIAATSAKFSDETKSEIFVTVALKSAPKCPICRGYLDAVKSISYDHVNRREDGGTGEVANGQLTHPYCNQAIKG